ncbi:exocyst complex component 3-like protein 2 isoform X4 [Heterocephalus glaber]|uniref:Exocyst complex component 3-like protein 2 isoform X4 n=1 Tax=Heterocephalus glaber TaxID=10181 RepID=A0AAX6QMB2_HETGA|nr:exocyst complex component 3-like protein 2 isoform X4 [Heterocephalus glaber]
MAVVRGRLTPAYPAGLGAFGVYLRGYHGALAEWLGASARRRLPLADRYALLHWHNQVYPREVLGLVDMVALENGELGPLLSPGTLRGLEDECVTDVKAQTRAALLRVLQEDEEHWGDLEDRPGSLAQDVCELLEDHTERAPRISQELGERMAHCCLGGLAEFLQSFQQRVERFHENLGIRELPPDTYISRTIALVNCGPPLRALAERLARVGPPESEPAREASASALDRVTRLCHRVLADLLFQELQPHFNKLMRRKWLSSPEALDGIVGTLGAQALALRRMQDEPYQESQASWLDAVVPHLAEVLQLEDTPSIQVEVAVLVRDYPDIRRKHVAALLDIRGLHSSAARQEILAVARDLELSEGGALPPPRDRAFFSDIPVPHPSFCLGLPLALGRLPLSRLARPSWACLPLRPRPPSPWRPRAQR